MTKLFQHTQFVHAQSNVCMGCLVNACAVSHGQSLEFVDLKMEIAQTQTTLRLGTFQQPGLGVGRQ